MVVPSKISLLCMYKPSFSFNKGSLHQTFFCESKDERVWKRKFNFWLHSEKYYPVGRIEEFASYTIVRIFGWPKGS